jgi:E3 ubiquitin-protein ligase RNF25
LSNFLFTAYNFLQLFLLATFQIVCPVCREPLPADFVINIVASMSSVVSENEERTFRYSPSAEVIKMQQTMSALYRRQLEKGGIIDAEAERNKYLVPKVTLLGE